MIDGEYTCGDVRCRENPGLASLHTLFVLEHNSIVDMLREKYHTLSGNELYERARRIVGAEIQNVAYGQYLVYAQLSNINSELILSFRSVHGRVARPRGEVGV